MSDYPTMEFAIERTEREQARREHQQKRIREVRRTKRRLKIAFLGGICLISMGLLAFIRWNDQNDGWNFFSEGRQSAKMAYDLGNRAVYLAQLSEMVSLDGRYQTILERQEEYPEALLRVALRNEEALDFVVEYPEKKNSDPEETIGTKSQGEIPLLIQWDEAWGYAPYGDETIVGVSGCGPTCIAMVASGLTGREDITPAVVAKYSADNGFLTETRDTSWDLLTYGAETFGIQGTELGLDENAMIQELSMGHPIIASVGPGDFTLGGHLLVIRDYQDGAFWINDPNSRENSGRSWTFEELSGQIVNLWSYVRTAG